MRVGVNDDKNADDDDAEDDEDNSDQTTKNETKEFIQFWLISCMECLCIFTINTTRHI